MADSHLHRQKKHTENKNHAWGTFGGPGTPRPPLECRARAPSLSFLSFPVACLAPTIARLHGWLYAARCLDGLGH